MGKTNKRVKPERGERWKDAQKRKKISINQRGSEQPTVTPAPEQDSPEAAAQEQKPAKRKDQARQELARDLNKLEMFLKSLGGLAREELGILDGLRSRLEDLSPTSKSQAEFKKEIQRLRDKAAQIAATASNETPEKIADKMTEAIFPGVSDSEYFSDVREYLPKAIDLLGDKGEEGELKKEAIEISKEISDALSQGKIKPEIAAKIKAFDEKIESVLKKIMDEQEASDKKRITDARADLLELQIDLEEAAAGLKPEEGAKKKIIEEKLGRIRDYLSHHNHHGKKIPRDASWAHSVELFIKDTQGVMETWKQPQAKIEVKPKASEGKGKAAVAGEITAAPPKPGPKNTLPPMEVSFDVGAEEQPPAPEEQEGPPEPPKPERKRLDFRLDLIREIITGSTRGGYIMNRLAHGLIDEAKEDAKVFFRDISDDLEEKLGQALEALGWTFEEFDREWEGGKSDLFVDAMNKKVQAEINNEKAKRVSWTDKISLKAVLVKVGILGGAAIGFGTLGVLTGGLAVGVGAGVAGTGVLGRLFGRWKKVKEWERGLVEKKVAEAMKKAEDDAVVAVSESFEDSADFISEIFSQTIREAAAAPEEAENINGLILYENVLKEMKQRLEQGGEEEKAQAAGLDLLIAGFQKRVDLKEAEKEARKNPVVFKIVEFIQKAKSGTLALEDESQLKNVLAYAAPLAVGAAATLAIAYAGMDARSVLAGVAGGYGGYKIGEALDKQAQMRNVKKEIGQIVEEVRNELDKFYEQGLDASQLDKENIARLEGHLHPPVTETSSDAEKEKARLLRAFWNSGPLLKTQVESLLREAHVILFEKPSAEALGEADGGEQKLKFDNLLAGIHEYRQTAEAAAKQDIDRVFKKTGRWRRWVGMAGGAALGVLGVKVAGEIRAYIRGGAGGGGASEAIEPAQEVAPIVKKAAATGVLADRGIVDSGAARGARTDMEIGRTIAPQRDAGVPPRADTGVASRSDMRAPLADTRTADTRIPVKPDSGPVVQPEPRATVRAAEPSELETKTRPKSSGLLETQRSDATQSAKFLENMGAKTSGGKITIELGKNGAPKSWSEFYRLLALNGMKGTVMEDGQYSTLEQAKVLNVGANMKELMNLHGHSRGGVSAEEFHKYIKASGNKVIIKDMDGLQRAIKSLAEHADKKFSDATVTAAHKGRVSAVSYTGRMNQAGDLHKVGFSDEQIKGVERHKFAVPEDMKGIKVEDPGAQTADQELPGKPEETVAWNENIFGKEVKMNLTNSEKELVKDTLENIRGMADSKFDGDTGARLIPLSGGGMDAWADAFKRMDSSIDKLSSMPHDPHALETLRDISKLTRDDLMNGRLKPAAAVEEAAKAKGAKATEQMKVTKTVVEKVFGHPTAEYQEFTDRVKGGRDLFVKGMIKTSGISESKLDELLQKFARGHKGINLTDAETEEKFRRWFAMELENGETAPAIEKLSTANPVAIGEAKGGSKLVQFLDNKGKAHKFELADKFDVTKTGKKGIVAMVVDKSGIHRTGKFDMRFVGHKKIPVFVVETEATKGGKVKIVEQVYAIKNDGQEVSLQKN